MKTFNIQKAGVFVAVVLIGGILFSGCSLFQKRYEKTEKKEFSINVSGKKRVVLDNTNGDIKIVKNTSDSMLRIKAEGTFHLTKKEMKEELDRIRIHIDSTGEEIKIKTDYIKEKRFINFQFNIGSEIDYELAVPEGIEVSVDNTNGKAEVKDVNNDISLNITNGGIYFDNPTGNLKVDITNGKIKGELDSARGVNFKITNGSISLALGDNFSGRFNLETVNGKIKTNDISFKDISKENKNFKGNLGDGKAEIIMETINGSIKLSKK
ncbi:MAG: hypothetical protein HY959_11480 [Ignavibacteriae bacterium]|nr:hypothetical protein [Ignavibacteriota bacterium]